MKKKETPQEILKEAETIIKNNIENGHTMNPLIRQTNTLKAKFMMLKAMKMMENEQ